jgi:DNA-binding response OmpR family regulator
VDGFEVMEWLRTHNIASDVSIIVMSSSGETADICRAAALGAKAYIVKPNDPLELVRVMERLTNYCEKPQETAISV